MTHPVFIRFGKRSMPGLHRPGTVFEVGKSIRVREGNDVAFIATGETVVPAFSGLGAPHWLMDLKAAIVGLTFGCNRSLIKA